MYTPFTFEINSQWEWVLSISCLPLLVEYPPLSVMDSGHPTATGYGADGLSFGYKNLYFDGDERKFEIWNEKFLGYMKIKKLKDILVGTGELTQNDNE